MLPSEYLEVQGRDGLKRLLAEQVDMQFVDLRTMLRLPMADPPGRAAILSNLLRRMLRLPVGDLPGGCNFAAASILFNLIAGSSVCFFNTSDAAFTERRDRGQRFKGVLEKFYPWQGEPVTKATAVEVLYEAARNPLAHSLGLEAPPAAGHVQREIVLVKRPLSEAEIIELEDQVVKPAWAGSTVTQGQTASGADRFEISVPALYWGVHRMLRALFADAGQVADADAIAKKFGPVWDKYIAVGDVVSVSDGPPKTKA
jgi:hypothetical protein